MDQIFVHPMQENLEARNLKSRKIIHYLYGVVAGTTKKMNFKCGKILNWETLI
jgi:hypothetical protein